MKLKYLTVMVVAVIFTFISACEEHPSTKEKLADTGLFGEHPLQRIEKFGSIRGSVEGNFFLGIGSVNGSLNSEFKLQFYWSPKPNEIVASSLPYSKFRFIIDDTKNIPTAEFVFDDEWLNRRIGYIYTSSDKANVNNFLQYSEFKVAKIRISSKMLEKEVYLPK